MLLHHNAQDENTCARVSFFNKVAGLLRLVTLLKKKLWHRCFPVNFVKYLRTFFYRTPSVAASETTRVMLQSSKLLIF